MKAKSLNSIIFLISFVFFFAGRLSFATKNNDTLKFTTDSSGIKKLNNLAYRLNYSNPDKAFMYAQKALKISDSLDLIWGIGDSFKNLAIVCQNTGQYEKGLSYCDSALQTYSRVNDSLSMASVYNTKATIHYYKANYNIAIKWYEKALQTYESENLMKYAAILLNNIGLALSETGNYKHALDYYFRALKLHEEHENQAGVAMTQANIGIVYFNLENPDKAMEFYKKSLELRLKIKDDFGIAACYNNMGNVYMRRGEYEKALEHFSKALDIFREKKDINNEAGSYLVIGNYYLKTGNSNKAIDYYRKTLEIGRQIKSKNKIAYASLNIAEALISQGKYQEAYACLDESKRCFKEMGDMKMLTYVYRSLTEYYENARLYHEALKSFKQYSQLHDSLLEVQSSKRVTEAELLYETKKKENEINLLTKEKELQSLQMEKHQQRNRFMFILAAAILLLAGFLLWRFIEKQRSNKMLAQKNKLLAEKSKQIEIQKQKIEEQIDKLKELDETKSRFFANISHEFRTPLTLIKGPVEDTIDHNQNILPETHVNNLKVSLQYINHLKKLTDQILDLTKLRAGRLTLKTRKQNLVPFAKRIINSFQSAIMRKENFELSLIAPEDQVLLYFDEQKLETVLYNLLSNAVKHSGDEGKITLGIETGDYLPKTTGDFVRISISDTGTGIREQDIKHIFSRFYSTKSEHGSFQEGTGIGLELTRELVELHGGQISVESTYGAGTCFYIDLPLGDDHLSENEIIKERITETEGELTKKELQETLENPPIYKQEKHAQKDAQKILVVEDNPEMRNYIIGFLKNDYNIIEAENGKEGLEKTIREKPDLIISDLMMPEMNGMEFLQQLRANKSLRDLTFIMLTARADDEDRISGFKAKADEYITKPFSQEEIRLRIRNLLQTRKQFKEKYSQKILSIQFDDPDLIEADKTFLNKLQEIVIKNLPNADFSVNELAENAFLSERQLRRKINELTALSPVGFIRQIRLLKAKELLENKVYFSISEVSTAVGFNNPPYFSKVFKKMFGKTPQQFIGKEPG
ncbi:MAG: tetratricopeptide repeat protein [Bacteroidales bacterium]|nr:tetratricopeptide repeat protein [Bacteroidales bacterium]MCF8343929.1 tetratricopeptide repeat protein [Bacteroidales bacterium]MCF8349938.1 tetratricopeptide repeat protein [Bacteroidales bacterium]MCF8375455.1 tetratricopeptide repeat protein [Bacteroidales bacterium]MCF8401341.1 tetratricopeptide repeat protein [Bacteroidales bacterium]